MRAKLLDSALFRITLAYAALFAVSVALLFGFYYWSTVAYLRSQTDAVIEAEIQAFAERYRREGLVGLTGLIAERLLRNRVSSSIYLLADPHFRPLAGNLNAWPEIAPPEEGWLEFRLTEAGLPESVHPARARHFVLGGGFHLLVGRNIQDLVAMEARMIKTALWIGAITLLLALGGGTVLSRGLGRRIESVNRISREIMSGSLSRRIPTGGSGDDFDQLIGNLNAMLDRIELLMEDMRRMTHNIAHDLRTPLTRLRVRLEALHAEPIEAGRARILAEEALTETDRLLATFNALLRIAEIESGKRRAGFRDLPLAEILTDVVELYEPLAEEKSQRISLDVRHRAEVRGDRDLLFQAFANVLDNAVKYAPEHGRIHIALALWKDGAEVSISDDGPGVPPAAREAVLERFVRLDGSRTEPGSGLGLSLVAAVARLHDARVRLADNAPGLTVVLTFPLVHPQSASDQATADSVQGAETLSSRDPPKPSSRIA